MRGGCGLHDAGAGIDEPHKTATASRYAAASGSPFNLHTAHGGRAYAPDGFGRHDGATRRIAMETKEFSAV